MGVVCLCQFEREAFGLLNEHSTQHIHIVFDIFLVMRCKYSDTILIGKIVKICHVIIVLKLLYNVMSLIFLGLVPGHRLCCCAPARGFCFIPAWSSGVCAAVCSAYIHSVSRNLIVSSKNVPLTCPCGLRMCANDPKLNTDSGLLSQICTSLCDTSCPFCGHPRYLLQLVGQIYQPAIALIHDHWTYMQTIKVWTNKPFLHRASYRVSRLFKF